MGFNVLVTDDSATMRAMVKKTLQMSGLPVTTCHEAANGREGLEVMGREWIDVVLLDINMPEMDGIEMIEKVKANPDLASIPLIVISTESSQTRIGEIKSKGVEFIHKPFTPEQVREVLVRVLGECENAGN